MTNRPSSTRAYWSTIVATGMIRQPSTITARAEMIDRPYPSRDSRAAAGTDTTA
jgi:hypothetical protein